MKTQINAIGFLLAIVLLASCSKDIEHNAEFRKSLAAWDDFKQASGNSYTYQVRTASWIGSSTETIITVRNGKVTGRSFISRGYGNSQPPAIAVMEEWEENESNLNTHQYGAPSLTLDEVYKKAKEDWLKPRKDATNHFEAANNGLISSCYYIMNRCEDDCSIGINIGWIRKL